jgi:hypothetical protein
MQTPSDAIPAFGRHSPSNDDHLRRPKDRSRPAFPEQRIAGLRPAYPERGNPGLRPASPEQRIAGLRPAYTEQRNPGLRPAPAYPERRSRELRPALPEQSIAGLRPAYPEQRNPGLRPALSEQRNRHLAPAPPPAPLAPPPAINSVGPHTAVLRYKTLCDGLMAEHRPTSQNDRDLRLKMHYRLEFLALPVGLPVSLPVF